MKKLIFAEIRNNSIEYLKEQICYKNIFTELFKLTNDQIERLDHGHEIKLKCNKKTTILDFYFIEQNIYINNEKINLFNVALIEKDVFKVYYYELEGSSISFYTLDSLLKFLYERFNFKIQERQLEKLNSYLMIKKFTA